jgi:N-acyl-D-amino-acid deacylase
MRARLFIAAIVLLSLPVLSAGRAQQQPLDLVIANARIVDGTGAPARMGDVGIRDGRIVRIGTIPAADARERLDAKGLVLAPGFIDVHTHADDVASHPLAENFTRMGVTSIVAGNCGSSSRSIGDALDQIRKTTVAVNFATLIGHNTVRSAVMGSAGARAVNRGDRTDALARLQGRRRWRGRILDRVAVRARHVRQAERDHRARA